MYLDFLVNIPNAPGKITYRRKNDVDCILRNTASADAFSIGRYAEHNGRLNHVTSRSLVESQPCNALSLVS